MFHQIWKFFKALISNICSAFPLSGTAIYTNIWLLIFIMMFISLSLCVSSGVILLLCLPSTNLRPICHLHHQRMFHLRQHFHSALWVWKSFMSSISLLMLSSCSGFLNIWKTVITVSMLLFTNYILYTISVLSKCLHFPRV